MDDGDRDTDTFATPPLPGDLAAETQTPPRGDARLVCIAGVGLGRVHVLRRADVIIGRDPDADLRIDGSDVSRRHARISWVDGVHVVRDLDSRNGTTVNGVPIVSSALRIGDRIQIGTSAILVYAVNDELEQRAMRLQKLDALATLSSGLAHDLKNSLTVILSTAELLRDWVVRSAIADQDVRDGIEDMLLAVGSARDVTQRLLYFARRGTPAPSTPVALAELVDEVVRLVDRSFGARDRITFDVDVDARFVVDGRRTDLYHALVNLALNARDAMPDGGRVTIRAAGVEVMPAAALELHLPAPGSYVELRFADTGVGMDDVTLARAFEPFFTTKRAGEGTGLGLSTVFGVIRDHGGAIAVESSHGHGTTFRIHLPVAPAVTRRAPTT